MVETHQVHPGGLKIMDMDGVFNHRESEFVGLTIFCATLRGGPHEDPMLDEKAKKLTVRDF
jgi:hypothetical protein